MLVGKTWQLAEVNTQVTESPRDCIYFTIKSLVLKLKPIAGLSFEVFCVFDIIAYLAEWGDQWVE